MSINLSAALVCGVFIKWNEDDEVFYLDGPDGMYTELCDYDAVDSYAEHHGLQYIPLKDPTAHMLGMYLGEIDQYDAVRRISVDTAHPATVIAYSAEHNLTIDTQLVFSIEY